MNEDLGIKYFYNEMIEKEVDIELKKHPSDFVVQEIADDKLCGFNFIIDMVKLSNSIHFLNTVKDKNRLNELDLNECFGDYELEDLYNLIAGADTRKESNFKRYILDSGLSFDDLQVGNVNLMNFIKLDTIDEIKSLWNEIQKGEIQIFFSEDNKILRTKVYQILNRIPFIKAKTVDGKILVEINSVGTYRAVVCKVMYNSTDIRNKISSLLYLRNGGVSFAGNKDKKAVTFQEVSIDANFDCIFNLAYEYYNDVILDILKTAHDDPLNKFFAKDIDTQRDDLGEISQRLDKNLNLISTDIYNYVNLSNYLIIKYILDKKLNRDTFLEIKQKIEAILEGDNTPPVNYCKSILQIYDIKRGDIKRLGDLKGNKFTIRLENVTEINETRKFINYFGTQRFGKCRNNHWIGEKILNREYEAAVEMIMKNSRGYEAFINADEENKLKEITGVCDGIEKYVFQMKLRGKTGKNIIYGLKREIRMIYLHAYQSYIYNMAINEEIEKRKAANGSLNDLSLDDIIVPLEKMADKMLKGGSRNLVSQCHNLVGKPSESHFEVSFILVSSSYATIAIRELLGKKK